MRRSGGRFSKELEAIMGVAANELLRRACTDSEFIGAIKVAVEEGDYRLLARVARNRGNEFPKSAKVEAARQVLDALRNAIEHSSGGSDTASVLELAEIMDAKWIPPELRLEAFLGLKTVLKDNFDVIMVQIERGDCSKEMRENYREFLARRQQEVPAEKPPSGKRPRFRGG